MSQSSFSRPIAGSDDTATTLTQYRVITGHLPDAAISNATRATAALASAVPRVISWRKCLRSVFGERSPMVVAICSCRNPMAASDLTTLRCSRLALKLGRGIDGYLLCREGRLTTIRCHFLERFSGAFEPCLLACEILPPQHDPVDMGRTDLQTVTAAPAAL